MQRCHGRTEPNIGSTSSKKSPTTTTATTTNRGAETPVHMLHVNRMRGATGTGRGPETVSREPGLWNPQAANRRGGPWLGQEAGSLRGKGQLQLFGVPSGVGQEPQVMMTGNAVSAPHYTKGLSCGNSPRVAQTASKGSECTPSLVRHCRLHGHLIVPGLV